MFQETTCELLEDQMESYLDEILMQARERSRISDLIQRFDGVLSNGSEWTSQLSNSSSEINFK